MTSKTLPPSGCLGSFRSAHCLPVRAGRGAERCRVGTGQPCESRGSGVVDWRSAAGNGNQAKLKCHSLSVFRRCGDAAGPQGAPRTTRRAQPPPCCRPRWEHPRPRLRGAGAPSRGPGRTFALLLRAALSPVEAGVRFGGPPYPPLTCRSLQGLYLLGTRDKNAAGTGLGFL